MAENEPADTWNHALDDLVALIDHPLPALGHRIENGSQEDVDDARAVAVAWGWLMRTKRTAQALLGLDRLGFGAEAAPLVCTFVEHAARLLWAARRERPEAVEILVGVHLDAGRGLNQDELELLGALQHEHLGRALEPDGGSELLRLFTRAERESHPGTASAAAYIEESADRHAWLLRLLPRDHASAMDAHVAALLLLAFEGYVRIAGLEVQFGPGIDALGARIELLAANGRAAAGS
ncbi:hypothetical protein SCMU_40440 [Sinomonas cyclohexanicum]|uniref:Uncharacterized protein n=1 Tax=Sinomonas cyclohexanicum TaxID=322009 RepID=A0ABM7Q199_SINCY|nr:hypothetical protein [Corynebacterium cyclohexanicum]BCT78202.1 hypothetical protein SCMU_40440 [Corynebacterium cyclohexanicum]